ncbi:C-terminal helicase domain-containing protein, partial [Deltaproteobacteria bacterium TL4]
CTDKEGPSGKRSPKINAIIDRVREYPEKTIIFSTFVEALYLIRDRLHDEFPDIVTSFIDGKTSSLQRTVELRKFREGNAQILLMGYKVGSEGLNITQATSVIFVEPWWCPAVHEQAMSRSHRYGQLVHVKCFCAFAKLEKPREADRSTITVEHRVLDICQKKKLSSEECMKKKGLDADTVRNILYGRIDATFQLDLGVVFSR